MATFGLSYTLENATGHTASKWYWRPAGTSLWTTIITSGMAYSVALQADNTIFDFAIQNINNEDNPTCATFQGIGFTDPEPIFNVSNSSISFEFEKPTEYITGYRATIALFSSPETVLQTVEISSPGDIVTGTFTGLSVATGYTIALLVAANEFDYTFNYNEVTTNLSTCYPPTNVFATLTSGTHLTVKWTSPSIPPSGGFIGSYRRKAVTLPYQTFTTSGTTSGNTYSLTVEAPTNYSGFIQSVCEDDTLSELTAFGVNAYSPLFANVTINPESPYNFIIHLNSDYGNPYDNLVQVHWYVNGIPNSSADVTYPANSTNSSIQISGQASSPDDVISDIQIFSISPLFNNGGELQQLDTVLTPDYFQFYSNLTSGTTWNGNPMILPSFTLDNFIPTEQESNSNITKGLLNFSWIYDSVYMDGVSPYGFITLQVIDIANSSVMGSVIFSTNLIGERNSSITITKQISEISPLTEFGMILKWADGSTLGIAYFYLPEF